MNSRNHPSIGFFRDRMTQLSSIRNACQHASPDTSMGTRLIGPDGAGQRADSSILQRSSAIESQFLEIEQNLNSLNELYNNRIAALSSFSNEISIESNIEALTSQITRMLTNLKNRIVERDPSVSNTQEAARISANMKKGYLARMRDISIRFREMQTNYLKRLNAIKSKAEKSSISESIDDTNSIEFDDLNDIAFTGNQNLQVMENEMAVQRRNEEIERLRRQLEEIKGLFFDLSQLIQEQGTILDRIDNNLSRALDEVKEGNKELDKAEKDQKSKGFYIYLIAMLILIIILGTIIIIRKAKKKKSQSNNDNDNNTPPPDKNTTSLWRY
ncbi:Syntaxin-16 [Tritrichomonas musculus]|uniref:Syntaxin-16 n=1 Tax=Tritrichomonas musculus TaxID=1915356 RepID=A0ABR2K868_9EUKA